MAIFHLVQQARTNNTTTSAILRMCRSSVFQMTRRHITSDMPIIIDGISIMINSKLKKFTQELIKPCILVLDTARMAAYMLSKIYYHNTRVY